MGVAGLGAVGVAGCTPPSLPTPTGPRSRPQCVSRDALNRFDRLGEAALHYEVNGSAQSFRFDPDFYRQLEAWWADWLETTSLGRPTRIDNYGSWVDGRGSCDSWHHSGRAFDIAELRRGDDMIVSCREDLWAGTPQEAERRRGYWALAAHLHIHFASVLTYFFDAAHRNHIHLDNGRSGSELSTFRSGSRVQVQVVQATARWLFDEPVEVTGRLDGPTRDAVSSVLDSLGRRGGLTSTDNWHAYLRAAAQRG